MKKTLLALSLLLLCTAVATARTLKVACVGNSITYGATIANREKNSYPAQLQAYLGEDYLVRNFGVSGTTLLSKGNYPYVGTKQYRESKDWQPDVVLIKLGTNDTKPVNWIHKAEFMDDYQKLIDSYKALESQPRIILLTPLRCFLTKAGTISGQFIEQEVRPMVEQLAWKNGLEIINLSNLFGDRWNSVLMPDQLHPSAIGAGEMARKIGRYIVRVPQRPTLLPAPVSEQAVWDKFNFHGYQGYNFTVDRVACKVVQPFVPAPGNPWVLRARFWGHEPQADIDLLEQGFHIAYCDVANLYGSDSAVQRWNSFYKYMTKAGFAKKVVLEGMSRGGLIVYRWAMKNPKRVAAIYADAPVMDYRSWPMGQGTSEGSKPDANRLLSVYGFDGETEALAANDNFIAKCAHVVAKTGIPVLHVVGDADDVVPVSENTALFEQEMQARKAPITVIHKPGVGHHPHSLNNPEPIVRFVLKATGRFVNECVHAVPGNEYRQGAGWIKGSEWHTVAEDIENTLQERQLKLLLLGNSITQGWGGTRERVTHRPGLQAMNDLLGEGTWETAGISGDCTQNLLWRIRHGNYNRCRPQNVVIAIGINNLITKNDDPEDVAEGIVAVAREARTRFPNSRIILLGLYPSGREKCSTVRAKCDRIHQILSKKKWKGVEHINPSDWFVDTDGTIRNGLYTDDYIHLTPAGYKVVADKLSGILGN